MKLYKWLGLVILVIWFAVWSLPDDKLHVIFCDVGQGDATLITYKTTQLLVDGGPGKKVLECLEEHIPFYDRRIEAVVLTHRNADHSKGLEYVRERYQVVVDSPVLVKGQTLTLGPIKYRVLWPDEKVLGADTISDENDLGIVGRLKYGDFDVLLTGDVASKYYADAGVGVEVVKIPHHGSKTGWEAKWWEKMKPKLAIISVGKNSFGHPTSEVIQTLTSLKITYLRTDETGGVEIVSDGKEWEVK